MSHSDLVPPSRQLSIPGMPIVPRLFLDAGERGWSRFVEFFTAHILNKNIRDAYSRAV